MSIPSSLWLNNLFAYCLQIGLLISIAGLLPGVLRMHSPRFLLRYYQLLLLVCLLLPVLQPQERERLLPVSSLSYSVPSSPYSARPLPVDTVPQEPILPPAALRAERPTTVFSAERAVGRSFSAPTVILGLLGAGVVLLFFRFVIGILRLMQYRRRSQSIAAVLPDIEATSRRIGTEAEIRISEQIQSPVTFGFRRPLILLPPHFPRLTESHRRAVVCHELLHVKRRDWLFILWEQLVCTLFWFHPAIWWLVDRIRLRREQVVDELAADLLQDRRQYAQALLESAYLQICPSTVTAPLFFAKNHLNQRVSLLFREVSMSRKKMLLSLVCMITVVLLAGIAAVRAFPLFGSPKDPSTPGESTGVDPQPILSTSSLGKITSPRLIHYVEPQYPEFLAGVSGTTNFLAVIDNQGKVLHQTYTSGAYTPSEPVFLAVSQWRFEPAFWNGNPVAYSTWFEIDFNIPKGNVSSSKTPTVNWRMKPGKKIQEGSCYHRLEPIYPEAAMRQGVEGNVVVKISVDEWGHVQKVEPLEGPQLLQEAAIQAARQYRYSQCRLGEKPVFFETRETVSFRLPKTAATGWMRNGIPVREIDEKVMTEKLKKVVRPAYPKEAFEQKVPGMVILQILVNESGDVEDSRVLEGHSSLHQAALSAIEYFKYSPIREYSPTDPEGKAIPVSSVQNVYFEGASRTRQGNQAEDGGKNSLLSQTSSSQGSSQDMKSIMEKLQQPKLLKQIEPIYPPVAVKAHVSGCVGMFVYIDEEGKVFKVKKAIGCDPLLEEAAVDAVRQWEYQPTLVEGQAVPVTTFVTVDFKLPAETDKDSLPSISIQSSEKTRVIPLSIPPDAEVEKQNQDVNMSPLNDRAGQKTMVASSEPHSSSTEEPIRAGGTIQPVLIKQVSPVYPELARKAGIHGVVLMQAIVSREGNVSEVKVIKGHPLLDQAAVDAVRQWVYKPTYLNGKPVSVLITVTWIFNSSPETSPKNSTLSMESPLSEMSRKSLAASQSGSSGPNQEPKLIKRVEPVYPETAKKAGIAGIVRMQISIDEEGKVGQVKIIRGHPLLDQAALDAVRQWVYGPAVLDGKPFSWKTTVTLTFDPSSSEK